MKNILLIVSLFFLFSCDDDLKKYPPPIIEHCAHNVDNSAECVDFRISKDGYTNQFLTNYICTHPEDYKLVYNYCASMREKLILTEAKISKCKKW